LEFSFPRKSTTSWGETPQTNSFVPSYSKQPFQGTINHTWDQAFQSNAPFQGDMPNQQTNVGYLTQNPPQLNLIRPSNYLQTTYGPIGIPMGLPPQNYQFPQVNRRFPFLATLDLPDLSRILNDPILHYPFWPVIPAKLLSDIPKFDG
jgi:hypothetical protein